MMGARAIRHWPDTHGESIYSACAEYDAFFCSVGCTARAIGAYHPQLWTTNVPSPLAQAPLSHRSLHIPTNCRSPLQITNYKLQIIINPQILPYLSQ